MKKNIKISINNLSLSFNGKKENLNVLDNISLNIYDEETLVIIGPSGCGKTTLLKLIGGLDINANTKGHILISNKLPSKYKEGGKVGFAFQNPVLFKWRNVYENVMLPLEIQNNEIKTRENDVLEALSIMGIEDFKMVYPSELSGGMKQRVNLARTIVHKPKLLLLDEPFGSLDDLSRLKLNYELNKLIESNRYTTILITHSLREALILADRIIILSNRPAKIFEEFIPSLKKSKSMGYETSIEFNSELARLSKIFLQLDNE